MILRQQIILNYPDGVTLLPRRQKHLVPPRAFDMRRDEGRPRGHSGQGQVPGGVTLNMRALAPVIQESRIDLIDRIDHGAGRLGFAEETHFFENPVGIRRTADGLLRLDVPT